MRSFHFKLKALLSLKENNREQALTKFVQSIKEVLKLEEQLSESQKKYHAVQEKLKERQKGVFRRDQIEALQSSLLLERENVSEITLLLNRAKEMQNSRRKIFLDHDSQYKAIDRLQEKQRDEHFFNENRKEQLELEDIIGSRFLFQRINEQV